MSLVLPALNSPRLLEALSRPDEGKKKIAVSIRISGLATLFFCICLSPFLCLADPNYCWFLLCESSWFHISLLHFHCRHLVTLWEPPVHTERGTMLFLGQIRYSSFYKKISQSFRCYVSGPSFCVSIEHERKLSETTAQWKQPQLDKRSSLKRAVVSLLREVVWVVVECYISSQDVHGSCFWWMKKKWAQSKRAPNGWKMPMAVCPLGTVFLISDPILSRTSFQTWPNRLETEEWLSYMHVWVEQLGEWAGMILRIFLGVFSMCLTLSQVFSGISLPASSLTIQILWIKDQGKDRWGNLPKAIHF